MTRFPRDFFLPRWVEFFDFLEERQRIWYFKEMLGYPPPWTADPVLAEAKFTNIYRELDRVSRFEIKELQKFQGDFKEQIRRILILRHTNSPRIYAYLFGGGNLKGLYDLWEASEGRDYFVSDALMFVCGEGYDRASWVWYYWEEVNRHLDQIYSEIFTEFELLASGSKTRKQVGAELLSLFAHYLPRVGPFISYEIVTSLTYCSDCPLTENDFLVVGPGAVPGLQILMEEDKLEAIEESVYDLAPLAREHLLHHYSHYRWIPEDFQPNHKESKKFTVRTLEHSLCEFRKYWRIKNGEVRIRRKYRA